MVESPKGGGRLKGKGSQEYKNILSTRERNCPKGTGPVLSSSVGKM